MCCSAELQDLSWSVQHCTFVSCAKVVPLSQFDMTVGMDWLIRHSLMHIDWKHKWIRIRYRQSVELLQGQLESLPTGSVIHIATMLLDATIHDPASLSPVVTTLLSEFQSVFEPPAGYLLARFCDHEIPLVAGAAPVQIRPNRYPPTVKDEIER